MSWIDRLRDERRELDVKISALSVFIQSSDFERVTPAQQCLMAAQKGAMIQYSDILSWRIAEATE